MKIAFAIVLLAGSAISAGLLWGTPLPLGIPGEWVWLRIPADNDTPLNLLLAAAGAALYATIIWVGGTRLITTGVTRAETGVWVGVLAAAAFGWLWCVQENGPPAASLGKAPFVLFYPSSSGYFTHARYESPEGRRFLRDYEALMQQGDVLHIGTHPPGLFCVFYVLIELVDRAPRLASRVDALQPESFRESLAVIATNSARSDHPLMPRDGTVLWLAALLAQGCAAATVVPIYGLLRWTLDRPAAFVGASLWPTVPAVAVFLPKSDAAFPFLAALFVWLTVSMWRHPRLITGFCAGLCAGVGMFFSLAFLPVVAFAFGYCAAETLLARQPLDRSRGLSVLAVAAGLVTPIAALWASTGLNLLVVWWWNYRNHAGFYAQSPRTYSLWLAANPLELAFAVGWPLMGAAVLTALQWVRQARQAPEGGRHASRLIALLVGGGVWLLLWITGKNSGEAARLWLLLMPGIVWLAAHIAVRPTASVGREDTDAHWSRFNLLAVALAVSVLTVHRVGGFHLE